MAFTGPFQPNLFYNFAFLPTVVPNSCKQQMYMCFGRKANKYIRMEPGYLVKKEVFCMDVTRPFSPFLPNFLFSSFVSVFLGYKGYKNKDTKRVLKTP